MRIRNLSRYIGAEIDGVDLAMPLGVDDLSIIRKTLIQRKVVFFRGQELDNERQVAFARQFGSLTPSHPFEKAGQDHPAVYRVDRGRYERLFGPKGTARTLSRHYVWIAGWHTDVSPAVNPPMASILRAEIVPDGMGDTVWTNLEAAYEGLSAPIQALADTLRAEHRYGASSRDLALADQYIDSAVAGAMAANHPVVRVHPESNKKSLFVNPGFTSAILHVHPAESRLLLELFFNQITRVEYTVRFNWNRGDVAMWDNRSTAHLPAEDLNGLDVDRVLHRVCLVGDVPVGPDGRQSELISGQPFGTLTQVPLRA